MAARNPAIDQLKLGLSLLIIALHIFPVSGLKGWQGTVSYLIANGITRVGVPTFFIVSGYLLRNKLNDRLYLLKYGKRILLLYVIWQLLYLPDLIRFYNLGKFSATDMVARVVYGYWHLWYLLATVGGVALLYLLRNISLSGKMRHVLILFALGYAYQLSYTAGLLNEVPALKLIYEGMGTTRNFVFMAYPFLLIGTLYEYWKNVFSGKTVLLFPLAVLLLSESYLYYTLHLGALDFYLLLLPLSMVLFQFAEQCKKAARFEPDSSLSLGVYLCHPYAIRLVYEYLPQRDLGFIFLKYILIAVIAFLLWAFVRQLNRKFPFFL